MRSLTDLDAAEWSPWLKQNLSRLSGLTSVVVGKGFPGFTVASFTVMTVSDHKHLHSLLSNNEHLTDEAGQDLSLQCFSGNLLASCYSLLPRVMQGKTLL